MTISGCYDNKETPIIYHLPSPHHAQTTPVDSNALFLTPTQHTAESATLLLSAALLRMKNGGDSAIRIREVIKRLKSANSHVTFLRLKAANIWHAVD